MWRAWDLSIALGSLAPADTPTTTQAIERAVASIESPDLCTTPELLLWLAGRYVREGIWLVRSDVGGLDAIRSSVDQLLVKEWVVRSETILDAARQTGVAELREGALTSLLPNWRAIGDDWYVRWSGTIADKAERVLALRGEPLHLDELNSRIGDGYATSTLQNALSSDERFVRISKAQEYALREWGLEEYSGIAQELTERIERAGGSVSLNEVVLELVSQFGVAETQCACMPRLQRSPLRAGLFVCVAQMRAATWTHERGAFGVCTSTRTAA